MKLSFVVVTRNSGGAIKACLDSIAVAVAAAAPVQAEIAVVDNGSTDATQADIGGWITGASLPVIFLSEPRPGKARALNQAIRATSGQLIACTDDDCVLHPAYVRDLLRHDAADTDPVLRGGRVALGDPADLPFSILLDDRRQRWTRTGKAPRPRAMMGHVMGCNITYRRALHDRLGPLDEDFGPGSRVGSGDDAEYLCRAYLAGVAVEYVPDMQVFHHHGRKQAASIRAAFRRYFIGIGAIQVKYLPKDPNLCRPYVWDLWLTAREIFLGTNLFLPQIGFSCRDKVKYATLGALTYLFWSRQTGAGRRWDNERRRAPPHRATAPQDRPAAASAS